MQADGLDCEVLTGGCFSLFVCVSVSRHALCAVRKAHLHVAGTSQLQGVQHLLQGLLCAPCSNATQKTITPAVTLHAFRFALKVAIALKLKCNCRCLAPCMQASTVWGLADAGNAGHCDSIGASST